MDSRKAQRRAEQERDEAVEARFTAKTVLEALKLAEACFPDRLVVLTSARASAETSPYLRQHADNPVEWFPWGGEALALARSQDKPILLSIGYSACHWCHVMAHESFEHAPTAAVMNELFVNIKLDREERPDLDRTYQLAHQALSRRGGGWPLTVFLMPDDLVPFYAGTYFPRDARHGLPAFVDVLRAVRKGFDEQRDALREQNRSLVSFITELSNPEGGDTQALTHEPVAAALTALARTFDPEWGGFGRAPKFPHTGDLELLLAVGTTPTSGIADGARALMQSAAG